MVLYVLHGECMKIQRLLYIGLFLVHCLSLYPNTCVKRCKLLSFSDSFKTIDHQLFSLIDVKNRTKEICASGCWELVKGGYFTPTTTDDSNPMLKITGSAIEINFAGKVIENTDTTLAGWIGIEIGYSPAELAANSSLRQPKDIVISNAHLRNFDCSILVHKGVERVVIKDSVFFDTSCGIVLLGDPDSEPSSLPFTQLNTEDIKDAAIINTKVFGHGKNRRDALVNLKTLIETTYAYTTDLFMPLRADRLNGDVVDMYTYSGLIATHVKNLYISCFEVPQMGYLEYATTSEGDTLRTEAAGIILRDCAQVNMDNLIVCDVFSEVHAMGLQLERVCQLYIEDSIISHMNSGDLAVGIETFPNVIAKTIDGLTSGFDFTVEEFDMSNVRTEFQRSNDTAIGIFLTDVRGLNGDKVFSERNIATSLAFGIVTFTSTDITFTNSSFSRNLTGATILTDLKSASSLLLGHHKEKFRNLVVGNVDPADGVIAVGAYIDDSSFIDFKDVVCSKNIGDNGGRGLLILNCNNCNFTNVTASFNNVRVGAIAGEDSAIRSDQDTEIISRQAPVVDAALTGAFGFFVRDSSVLRLDGCKAMSHSGYRAFGIMMYDCSQMQIQNCEASGQQATGSFLHSDVLGLTATDVPFPSVHVPLLAGNACDLGAATFTGVDHVTMLIDFLNDARELREDINGGTAEFSVQETTIAGFLLVGASMARFRLWGVAFGMYIYNGERFTIDACTCSDQISEKDSAIGLVIAGRSSDMQILNSNFLNNKAWTDSVLTVWANAPSSTDPRGYYQYDLSEMKDYWYITCGQFAGGWDWASTDSVVGLYTQGASATDTPTVLIAQGEQFFGTTSASGAYPHVEPGGASAPNRIILPPFAPAASGVMITDVALSGRIESNNMHGNYGHSGHGFGLAMQNAFSMVIDSNKFYNNGTNIYGMGFGILDCTSYSPNMYIRNVVSNNKMKDFVNANTLIPMGNVGGQSLQMTIMENGQLSDPTTEFHNIEIQLPTDSDACVIESSIEPGVQDETYSDWSSWVVP